MGLLNLERISVGEVGVKPGSVKMVDTNNLATITAAGYLNGLGSGSIVSGVQLSPSDLIECLYSYNVSTGSGTFAWFQPSISNGVITLVGISEGDIVLPSIANRIVYATDTSGNMSTASGVAITNGGNISAGLSGTAGYLASFPATLARGSLRFVAANSAGDTVTQVINASQAAARIYTIPDGGQSASNFLLTDNAATQTIATGSLALTLGSLTVAAGNIAATLGSVAAGTTVTGGTGVVATTGNVTASAGNVVAGATGAAGSVTAFAGTGANEFVRMDAINNTAGDFSVTVRNAASIGQSQVVSVPDAGAATANFLLDTGAANILAKQQFLGINDVINFGTGTWTTTRIALGNYVKRHTPGDETSIIAVDITPQIRVAASKGFRLDSFDYVYGIAANALDAHSAVLDLIAYANNVAVSVTSVPITATLATATQANPYLTNCTVTTPAFDVTADTKYVLEITVNNAAASEYDYYGLMLRFSETIG